MKGFRMSPRRFALIAVTVWLVAQSAAAAQPSFQGIGFLPGPGNPFSVPERVSDNGEVIVGRASSEIATQAFRWTAKTGLVGLGFLPGGLGSAANDVSSCGSSCLGFVLGTRVELNEEVTACRQVVAVEHFEMKSMLPGDEPGHRIQHSSGLGQLVHLSFSLSDQVECLGAVWCGASDLQAQILRNCRFPERRQVVEVQILSQRIIRVPQHDPVHRAGSGAPLVQGPGEVLELPERA